MLGEKEVFAKNLRKYMEQYDLQGIELADMLGVSRSAPSTWLCGVAYPRMDKIEQMAKIFNCQKSDLIESDKSIAEMSRVTEEEYKMLLKWRTLDKATQQALLHLMKRRD